MLVSVIVTSYNHARYLAQALDSALNQSYAAIEVIAVDDGSSDGSQDVIARYGTAVRAVFKANGGHASALNAGFAVSRGDLVCPLDSDDLFAKDKVARVVEAAKQQPEALLILHRLQTIDAKGDTHGAAWPRKVSGGNIGELIVHSGGWWPRPTTSGLVFARRYLSRVLPMPIGPRIWPDTYLAPPAALLAPVIGLPATLGFYRSHGENTILKYFPTPRTREERKEIARRRVEQHVMEHRLLVECMHRLQDRPPTITLDRHPEYQRFARQAYGEVSLTRVLSVIAQCRTMSTAMKFTELAKIAVHRG